MLINELSKRTGVSTHTIRFYERYGLLQGKRNTSTTTNNYYHYDEECVERLKLIIDAKSGGFTLREITEIIDAWYTNTYTVAEKREILEAKVIMLDQRITELKDMKKRIRDCIKEME